MVWKTFEERPERRTAVPVWFDTVEAIAAEYCNGGYESHVVRRGYQDVTLRISHAGNDRHPACELVIDLPGEENSGSMWGHARKVLVRGHPPTVELEAEFLARWREVEKR